MLIIANFTIQWTRIFFLKPTDFYMVELQGAEKPIFAVIDTMKVNVPSVPRTDYPISLTRHGLAQAKVHSLAK